jgi:hypothetical protein
VSVGRAVALIVLVVSLLVVLALAALSVHKAFDILQSCSEQPMYERLQCWLASALYVLIFAVLSLILVLLACIAVYMVKCVIDER